MKILKLPEVIERCSISRSLIYDYARKGKFPKPIPLGERSVGWLEAEISGWIAARADLRQQNGGQK